VGGLKGGVVGTVMSNFGLERALAARGIPFVRAKVGDRYVLEELHKRGWDLGGEASGHIVCLDLNTTGDGIVSALQVLAHLKWAGRPLSAVRRDVEKMPQTLVNVVARNPGALVERDAVKAAVVAIEARLAERGRVLLRPSGTEPVVRVMVKAKAPPSRASGPDAGRSGEGSGRLIHATLSITLFRIHSLITMAGLFPDGTLSAR
jgi:phosphoglucosamine mutase